MPAEPHFSDPEAALRALAERMRTVDAANSTGTFTDRVLGCDVVADHDSPAADVSAMDGYAVRLSELSQAGEIPVSGDSIAGAPPPELVPGAVVRIFTGAVIPAGCEAVIKREETIESGRTIRWLPEASLNPAGANIRRQGENIRRGEQVLNPGKCLTAPDHAAIAAFGRHGVPLAAKVRVSLLTTGNEVLEPHEVPQPWQLRNSNRAAVTALLQRHAWIEHVADDHVRDDREELLRAMERGLSDSDALILTGGVSMGDHDYVPEIVEQLGGEIVFHRLPIRPGKPILGAATRDGKLILGLPGNPVSATIGCHRFTIPLLARISGQSDWLPRRPAVELNRAGGKTLPLWWFRPVKLIDHGIAEPIESKGSGDLVALTRSTGFIELPPHATGTGPWPYWAWL